MQLKTKADLQEQKHFTGSIPLLTQNHSLRTYDRPKVVNSTTILRNVMQKLALGGQESYNRKAIAELLYPII